MADDLQKGLDEVLVAESSLSYIDGDAGQLVYHGYDIKDLAREASFEEVLYLLWNNELPERDELDVFVEELSAEYTIEEGVVTTLEDLVAADERPMAAVRTAVSMLSASDDEDPEPGDIDAIRHQGLRIAAKFPTILAAYDRLRNGEEPVEPNEELSYAANFLYMLHGEEPDDVAAETFDMALILHADHGLNASTFTSMVIASTLADTYSSVTGGISALSGSLHGGANQDVMEVLLELDESGQDPTEWIAEQIDDGRRIPGWGHRVYNVKDPRAEILTEKSEDLGNASGEKKWYDYAAAIEEYLTEEEDFPSKGLAPNVDFYSGTVYYQLGIPLDMYTPIFAMSRTAGWVGHILEYQTDNRLIRPRARYVGPQDEAFVPIDER
ncbi:citrate synthase [Halococcus sp. IIIV-5B]|uniref:citrate synthase n=1 Tax=Halococcus sp. IIIV-5B TaxID=2321230 RepID=UPI000E75DEC7|nr:citrate synthase [Halococcus sp. IIIV-5B]RJT03211.1 citrate synthase [Halococcus sp. IIIV-5B]